MKKLLLILFVIVIAPIIIIAVYPLKPANSPKIPTLELGTKTISVKIADTPKERAQGLSGRPSLEENHGMLFIFETKSTPSFWMKDMQFPLDIVWIDEETVVDITYNLPPAPKGGSYPTYQPSKLINKVLEVNAGVASSSGVQIGDTIVFRL